MAPKVKKFKKVKKPGKLTADVPAVISDQLKKRIVNKTKFKKSPRRQRGIVFIRNLPKRFAEQQLKNYFKQFGKITNMRVVRSNRTGASKGYAYIEFDLPEVAQIAAETMDMHQMFQKIVKAAYIPPEEQKYNYFKSSIKLVKNSAGKVRVVSKKNKQIASHVRKYNDWNEANYEKRYKSTLAKMKKLKDMFPDLEVNFDDFIMKPSGDFNTSNQSTTSHDESSAISDLGERTDNGDEPQKGNLLLIKKGKKTSLNENTQAKKKAKISKKNTSLSIEDLLGNTLVEDSSDEEFIPSSASDENDIEEEQSDHSDAELEDDTSSESDAPDLSKIINQKGQRNLKVKSFENVLKKNPKSKGIQKPGKKNSKKMENKQKLKAAAARELLTKENKQHSKKIQKKVK